MKGFSLSSSERQNPRNAFQTTKLKNVDFSETYFRYLIVVKKGLKKPFIKK